MKPRPSIAATRREHRSHGRQPRRSNVTAALPADNLGRSAERRRVVDLVREVVQGVGSTAPMLVLDRLEANDNELAHRHHQAPAAAVAYTESEARFYLAGTYTLLKSGDCRTQAGSLER